MERKRVNDVVWVDAPAENFTGRARFEVAARTG